MAPLRYRIAVFAFDGIRDFHLSVPGLVFGEERQEMGGISFDMSICAVTPGQIRTAMGLEVHIDHGLEAFEVADIVIVPSWELTAGPADEALLEALRSAHRRGARLVGLCLGAFLLAETGLLAGRTATTHWYWARTFSERFPAVQLDANVLYVDDGGILTSAGTVAGLDCCLHLLRTLAGSEAVNRLARMLVTPPHRQGNQAQFIEQPVARTQGDTRLTKTLDWALAQLKEELDIDTLAAHAGMSRRTFTRHFQKMTGTTVMRWLTTQRLRHAQRLLETTRLPMERVAEEAGFGSALSMRQRFVQFFNITPGQYRREFQGQERGIDDPAGVLTHLRA